MLDEDAAATGALLPLLQIELVISDTCMNAVVADAYNALKVISDALTNAVVADAKSGGDLFSEAAGSMFVGGGEVGAGR